MSSHGGILGVVAFTLIYSRRHKLPWTNPGDNLCVVAPIGLFLGRCANFINGELYGRVANVPWAVQFPKELLEPANSQQASYVLRTSQGLDPSITSVEGMIEAARAKGIGIYPVSALFVGPRRTRKTVGLVMGYSALLVAQIERGCRLLAQAVAELD